MDKYIQKINQIFDKDIDSMKPYYAVGGYCRDRLTDNISNISDIDIIYTGDISKLLQHIRNKGLSICTIKKEISIFRIMQDDLIVDISSLKGQSLEEDLKDRDFTINSIAYDIKNDRYIDPYGGIEDLQKKIIRKVNKNCIVDDYIRILRAARFANQYCMKFEENLGLELKNESKNIFKCPKERIFIEIMKMIDKDFNGDIFYLLDELFILQILVPDINKLKEIGKCKYHIEDVFTHMNMVYKNYKKLVKGQISLEGLSLSQWDRKIAGFSIHNYIAFACFFHDIGKYQSLRINGDRVSFIGHEIKGKEIMSTVCDKLGFSNEGKKLVETLIEAHMYALGLYKNNVRNYKKSFYKFFTRYDGYIEYIIAVSYCDLLATKTLFDPENEIDELKGFLIYILNEYKVYKQVKNNRYLDGKDIMNITGVVGKEVGEKLEILDKKTYFGLIKNKEEAIYFFDKNTDE